MKNLFSGKYAGLIVCSIALGLPAARGSAPAQVTLDGSIKPVAAMAAMVATGSVDPSSAYISRDTLMPSEKAAKMEFEVALKMRNFAEFQSRVATGERISPQEVAAKYEPLAADYQAVDDWLTSQGLTITRRDAHHLAIFARGTVSQVQQATKATFARVTKRGHEYTSAVTAPSVPSSISPLLIGINGLQPHLRAHNHLKHPDATAGTVSYTPAQIAQAYQATGLYNTNITGAGQTIAIVIDTFPSTGDVISFWQTNHVAQSIGNLQFIQAVPLSTTETQPIPSGEETLDVEWSSAIAPGAKVRVYATTDLANADLDQGYAQVLADVTAHPEWEIHQMTMSFGEGENGTTRTQVDTDDQYFAALTNAGVTVFASSGDEGSTPGVDEFGDPDESGPLVPETPASDPNVIGVGGTTLTLDNSNNESSEIVWNNGSNGGASGGGTSTFFTRPSWQKGTGVTAGSLRLVPDISCSADPNFGATLIYGGTATVIGGTSWASPTCAAFCALINQARANAGLSSIGQLGPLIYPLIRTSNFRDITTVSNATASSGGAYRAGAGYDEASGIGVPLVQTLAQTLVGSQTLIGVLQQPAVQTILPGANATYTVSASGSPTSYQWQRMPLGTTTWSNLADNGVYAGSATHALTISNATTAMSGDQFQCVVTYAGTGPVTSSPSSTLIIETPWVTATLAGQTGVTGLTNGAGTAAKFNYPTGTTMDISGNLYVADLSNNVIRKVTPQGAVTTPFGSVAGTAGSANGTGNGATFSAPRDVALDSSNNLYVVDEGNNLIRKISLANNAVSTFSSSSLLNEPRGIAIDSSGNVYIANSDNDTILKITPDGKTVSTLAGQSGVAGYADGMGTQALFNGLIGMALDSSNNLYVADYGNNAVRKVTPGGMVTTVAGIGGVAGYVDGPVAQSLFNVPRGVMVDATGNLYVTDSYAPITAPPFDFSGNNLIRKITPAGVVSTLAGLAGIAGGVNGTGSAAEFYDVTGIVMNTSGALFMSEAGNNTIRSATIEPGVSLSATQPNASVLGPVAGQFTVTRTGSTSASLRVNYSVAGTAVSGTDYTALSGAVTISAGQSSATIAVTPIFDSQATTNRTVQLTLTNASATLAINPTPATVTIMELIAFSQWEGSFFTTGQLADPTVSGPLATPQGDSIPNLLKYLYNINPSRPMIAADREALPVFGMTSIGTIPYLTLTYAQYQLETGITINVQASPDLQTWTTLNSTQYLSQPTGSSDANGDPYVEVEVPVSGSRQFIRLNVTQP